MAAAMQPASCGQITLKMEAAASSATGTEEKELSAALPRTISMRVQQLFEVGHHLDGRICSCLLLSAAAPACSPAATPLSAVAAADAQITQIHAVKVIM